MAGDAAQSVGADVTFADMPVAINAELQTARESLKWRGRS